MRTRKATQVITRDVEASAVADLALSHPRAALAATVDDEILVLPVSVTLEGPVDPASSPRIVQVSAGNPDLAGRNVVVIVDDGPQWFRLRSLTVRGVAEAVGGCTYRVVPERIVAWDYGSLREAPTSPGNLNFTNGVVFGCRRHGRGSAVPLSESGSGASQLASHDSCQPFAQGNAICGTAVVRPSSRPHLYDDLGFVVDGAQCGCFAAGGPTARR